MTKQIVLHDFSELAGRLGTFGTDTRVFLVTGKQSFVDSGAKEALSSVLQASTVTHFSGFTPNPNIEDVETGLTLFQSARYDVVLAVGGGSAIDVAKAIRILAAQPDYTRERVRNNQLPQQPGNLFVAVPTTAGSGAEATHFAVVYEGSRKYSLASPAAVPDIVVLDPQLTASLPPNITAESGIDAITQAIEAYWSTGSTEESRLFSRKAIRLLLPAIESAVKAPSDQARAAMLEGAHLAGQAINIAKTTACHALSYGLTALHGVPHGQAVCVTLPQMIVFNAAVTAADCQDVRGASFVTSRLGEIYRMLGAQNADEAAANIEQLITAIGLESRLPGIRLDEKLLAAVEPNRLANNPRSVSNQDIVRMLGSALSV